MKIRLNGEPHELAGPLTVTALLTGLDIDPRRVAVEHNQIVVKRAAYDTTLVQERDEVEIVNFVGGGSGLDRPGQWRPGQWRPGQRASRDRSLREPSPLHDSSPSQ